MKVRRVMKHPRGVMEHPSKDIETPFGGLVCNIIVLRTPTKELSELPIFNSVIHVKNGTCSWGLDIL